MISLHNGPVLIALADDHLLMRRGLAAVLHELGEVNICAEASNGRELIQAINNLVQLPHICILDIHMPVMNGFEALSLIRDRWPAIKLLVISVCTEDMYLRKMMQSGADAYLPKGCDPRQLAEAINALLSVGKYYTTAYAPALLQDACGKICLPVIAPKEEQLLRLIGTEMTYQQIAVQMRISVRSVEGLRDNLFDKLKVHTRQGLTRQAIGMGYIPLSASINPFTSGS